MVLKATSDADLVELFGEVEGVGVLAEGGEHLGADGDDFGFHKGRCQVQVLRCQLQTWDQSRDCAVASHEQGDPIQIIGAKLD